MRIGTAAQRRGRACAGCHRLKEYVVPARLPARPHEQAHEANGVATAFPHPARLYRQMVSKLWAPALCGDAQYRIPRCVRLDRARVLGDPAAAAAAGLGKLNLDPGSPVVLKLGYSWESADVIAPSTSSAIAVGRAAKELLRCTFGSTLPRDTGISHYPRATKSPFDWAPPVAKRGMQPAGLRGGRGAGPGEGQSGR